MSEHYDFHYQPTGSGAISGQQVLQQTEDAINELGDYVNDNVGGAMDVAQQALETAQNAEQDAQTALDTANSFSSAIQSAQQDANTALSTAQTAQTTASNANNTAIQAQQDASSAVTTANNASGQVSTLSGTVTALGQRVTTAEGNIGQNTSDISSLTTRVGTAEGNITTLQNDVSVAMGNASSAMATAGTVKQQSYVLRYSSSSVTDNSTIAYSTLDNTDNIKSGDKVIDVNGKIFSVVSVDTANQTVTVGSALIDLALDGNIVHTSGNETVGGQKTFTNSIILQNSDTSGLSRDFFSKSQVAVLGDAVSADNTKYRFVDKNDNEICYIRQRKLTNSNTDMSFCVNNIDNDNNSISAEINFVIDRNNDPRISPSVTNSISLGRPTFRWKSIYSNSYYYKNVEFSTKFVTTDTDQTISGAKYFKVSPQIYNSDLTASEPNLVFKNSKYAIGDTTNIGKQSVIFADKNNAWVGYVSSSKNIGGTQQLIFRVYNKDSNDTGISSTIIFYITKNGDKYFTPDEDSQVNLGSSSTRWKSFNGLTPSSLGMPSDRSARIDISSYFTNTGTGDTNTYTVPANGYINLTLSELTNVHCFSSTSNNLVNYCQTFTKASNSTGVLYVLFPVRKNDVFLTTWYTTTTVNVGGAYFIPCQGNV